MSCSTSSSVTRGRARRAPSRRRGGLVIIYAGEWFVEQKNLRIGGEPDRNAERAQVALRQIAGDFVLDLGKAEKFQDFIA